MSTSEQINAWVKKNLAKNVMYLGAVPSDKMPSGKIFQRPVRGVINTDDSTGKGVHWRAFGIEKDNLGFYFDSYGLNEDLELKLLNEPENSVMAWLKDNGCNKIIRNIYGDLQELKETTCGHWSAYACVYPPINKNDKHWSKLIKLPKHARDNEIKKLVKLN